MYITERDRILELLDTLSDAVKYAQKNKDEAFSYIEECLAALISIKKVLEKAAPDYNPVYINSAIEEINIFKKENDASLIPKEIGQIKASVSQIKASVKKIEVRWQALFLPYKAAMWTALDSIWKAASEDPNCDVTVVAIPYYDLDSNFNKIKMHYEGDKFPDYVPVVHYKDYSIEKQNPEMIFIHNPYDEGNTLTRIDEKYYARNIKPYTKCLVYSPYFTFGNYVKGYSDFQYAPRASFDVDKIIVQSDKVKQLFRQYGHPSSRMLTVGTPKADAVINSLKEPVEMPEEWQEKIAGKKVFLLNTHLNYFPASASNMSRAGDYAVRFHREILDALVNKEDRALIWRPHPLLKMTLERYPKCLDFVNEMEKTISESENCVMDKSADYMAAFQYSDAMISTYSSLIHEYMLTGKPIFIFQTKIKDEIAEVSPIDYRVNYFLLGTNGVTVEQTFGQFIDMVLKHQDPLYEKRMKMIKNAFLNIDGTAGKCAYDRICREILK